MGTLKELGAAVALILSLAFAVFADSQPPVPGEIQTPPRSSAQTTPDDSVSMTQPSASTTPGPTEAVEISAIAIDVLLGALSVF